MDITHIHIPEDDPIPAICADCRGHEHGDRDAAVIQRLQDHEQKVRWLNEMYREKLNSMQAQRDQAFDTRNSWRPTLVELVLNHVLDEGADDGRRATALVG